MVNKRGIVGDWLIINEMTTGPHKKAVAINGRRTPPVVGEHII